MGALFAGIIFKVIDILLDKFITNEAKKKAMLAWADRIQSGNANTAARLNQQYESLRSRHKSSQ